MNGGFASPAWPTQTEYQEAFTAPALCLADPELRAATAADWSAFGLPQPIAGQFANVYRMKGADGTEFAVRVFLRARLGRDAHFRAVAARFAAEPNFPSFLVPFAYQERGICLRGEWFPVQKQPWVNGKPLNLWIEGNLYEAALLRKAAEAFRVIIAEMQSFRFAHGDLQHGNILVEENGALRLIDYDGAWVLARAGYPLREAGHPAYQHPRRTVADYNARMDDFPALVLYAALRALAIAPNLWFLLDNGDNVLFRPDDFRNPTESRGFRALADALRPFPSEMRIIERVREAADGPLTLVPTLERS